MYSGDDEGGDGGMSKARATSETLDREASASGADVLAAVIAEATGGNVAAAEAVLKRLWPVRGRLVKFEVPDIGTPGAVGPAMERILRLAGEAVLTIEEAERVTALIERRAKRSENAGFADRYRRLQQLTEKADEDLKRLNGGKVTPLRA
jgi:cysteine synthase